MKKIIKKMLVSIFGWQVRRLRAKNNFKIVAVVGSIGKTSTKYAIAKTLSATHKVQWQQGNYNDILSVPMVFFGHQMPNILNPFAWLRIFINNERQISRQYDFDFVVLELGTDGPGQIQEFKKYLKVDIAYVTAVTPEHMEYFKHIDHVAQEELSVSEFSNQLVINTDLVDKKYLKSRVNLITYGFSNADYVIKNEPKLTLKKQGKKWLEIDSAYSQAEAYSKSAAAIASDLVGMGTEDISKAISGFEPVPGRMQLLAGINNSIIIDDTYNASPDACIASLRTLYLRKGKHKIALLGNMNELGASSAAEHKRVGEFCDPKKLDLVVTLGPDANKYLAPAAKANGCEVKSFNNPYDLGVFVKKHVKPGALILAKGSQNKVFMEEAVKILLDDYSDAIKLVRQSDSWLKKKQKNFNRG